jgi:hypothetical protein
MTHTKACCAVLLGLSLLPSLLAAPSLAASRRPAPAATAPVALGATPVALAAMQASPASRPRTADVTAAARQV